MFDIMLINILLLGMVKWQAKELHWRKAIITRKWIPLKSIVRLEAAMNTLLLIFKNFYLVYMKSCGKCLACLFRYPKKPEEGVKDPENRANVGCQLSSMWAGTWILEEEQVFWTPSHLSCHHTILTNSFVDISVHNEGLLGCNSTSGFCFIVTFSRAVHLCTRLWISVFFISLRTDTYIHYSFFTVHFLLSQSPKLQAMIVLSLICSFYILIAVPLPPLLLFHRPPPLLEC